MARTISSRRSELALDKPAVTRFSESLNLDVSSHTKTQIPTNRKNSRSPGKPSKARSGKTQADGKRPRIRERAAKELEAPQKVTKPCPLKYQKIDVGNTSWNFRRSPRFKRLKLSLLKTKERRNPFFRWKGILKKIKIPNAKTQSRYMAILSDGLLFTGGRLGIGLTSQIRIVRKLSFRNTEILLSKLPFWATSYSTSDVRDIVRLSYKDGVR
jgi:hypothetical protein